MLIIDQDPIPIIMGNSLKYYRSIGYSDEETKYGNTLMVTIDKLPVNSNKEVECSCDECKTIFKRSLQMLNRAKIHLCKKCSYDIRKINIDYTNTIKASKSRVGPKHNRWNPNKTEYKIYCNKVNHITRKQNLSILENYDKPRGLCGIEGAYQLDHIISVKYGFDNNINPEIIGNINNLRFIPWKENRNKWYKIGN